MQEDNTKNENPELSPTFVGTGGIIPLSEGTFTVDKTKLFVPFNEQEHQLQNRPSGSLLVEIQPFVITTSDEVLLLDTGLGFKTNGTLQLHQNMVNSGIDPSRVTKVFFRICIKIIQVE